MEQTSDQGVLRRTTAVEGKTCHSVCPTRVGYPSITSVRHCSHASSAYWPACHRQTNARSQVLPRVSEPVTYDPCPLLGSSTCLAVGSNTEYNLDGFGKVHTRTPGLQSKYGTEYTSR